MFKIKTYNGAIAQKTLISNNIPSVTIDDTVTVPQEDSLNAIDILFDHELLHEDFIKKWEKELDNVGQSNNIVVKILDKSEKIQSEKLGYLEGDGFRITAKLPQQFNIEVIVSNYCWQLIATALKEAIDWQYKPASNCWTNETNKSELQNVNV